MEEQKTQQNVRVKIKENPIFPPLYNVVFHNDEITTMEFVIDVLIKIFRKDKTEATKIMYKVHKEGKGVAGKYTYDIAKTKVQQSTELARSNGFPLLITVEPDTL